MISHSWVRASCGVSRVFFVLSALAISGVAWIGCARNPTQQRDSYFQRGRKYFQQNKYADAAIEFQNAVKIDPRFAQGYYYLGLADKMRNDLQSAFQDFSKEMEVDPTQTPGAIELGNLYLTGNQPTQAKNIANAILAREPHNFSALLLLAQSDLGEKNYAQARKELDELRAMRPDDAPIYLAIGIAQLGGGDYTGAESSFRRGIQLAPASSEGYRDLANLYLKTGRPASAEQILQQGIKSTANARDLHFALADSYCRWGRLAEAQATLTSLEKAEKPTADLHSMIGDFWVAHSQLRSALAEYQAAYALAPSLLLEKKFVNVYITLGNVTEAEHWNQEILKAHSKDQDGQLFAGAIAHMRGDDPTAIQLLGKALANNSKSAFAHYYFGVALMAVGKDDDAKTQFFDCLKTNPKFSYAFLQLGKLSLRAKDAQGATQYAQEVEQLSPTMLDGYLLGADAAILGGDTARAEQELQLANHFASGSPAVVLRQAVLDGLRKNYVKAESEYQSVLAKVKDPAPILAELAQMYVQQKQTARAIQAVSSFASGPKANSGIFVLLAQLHILQNDLSAAKSDCQQALRMDGKNARAYFDLGRIAELQDNDSSAIENYARAAQLNPADSLPNLLAGDLSRKLERWSEAQKYYQRVLTQSPGTARAQAGLALTMVELGEDPNVALSLARQARSSAPSDPVPADALGWVYFKQGLSQQAIPLLRQAVDKQPQEASFRYHLGMAYSAAGDKSEARLALVAARKLGLSGPEAEHAEQTLALLSAPSRPQ